jgi:hypothetical protein
VDDEPLKFNEWMCRWAVDNNETHHALTSLLVGLQKKIPTSWLDGDKSYWAPYKSQDKIDRAVKSAENPRKIGKNTMSEFLV